MRKHLMLLTIAAGLFGCDQSAETTTAPAAADKEPVVASRGTSDTYIPIVAVGYQHGSFGGARRYFYIDENNLNNQGFNDAISSIKVYKGPNYANYVAVYGKEPSVAFCTNASQGGACIRYTIGDYPSVSRNDAYSSVVFNLDPQLAETATPRTIPAEAFPVELICRMFSDIDYGGRYMDILGTQNSEHSRIDNFADQGYNDYFSSAQILRGPNWIPGSRVYFYWDKNQSGRSTYATCTDGICKNTPDFRKNGYNDVFSSSYTLPIL